MLWAEYINRFFRGIVLYVTNLYNGQPAEEQHWFRRLLRTRYSVTGKWSTVLNNNSRVAADYVALDSSLPLKARGVIRQVSGDIPKVGIEYWKNETQLTEIDLLEATGAEDEIVAGEVLSDVPAVIDAIDLNIEFALLRGFSTGVALIPDDENVGTGISVDYGYLPEHSFGVSVIWNTANAATSTPIDDIERVRAQAQTDGNQLLHMWMDRTAFNGFVASEQVRAYYAAMMNIDSVSIRPSFDQISAVMSSDTGSRLILHLIDKPIRKQANGVDETVFPWQTGMVIFTDREDIGELVYAPLAENRHRAPEVAYQVANDYTLVSVKTKTDPSLSIHTKGQARVIPVVTVVNSLYQLNSQEVQG